MKSKREQRKIKISPTLFRHLVFPFSKFSSILSSYDRLDSTLKCTKQWLTLNSQWMALVIKSDSQIQSLCISYCFMHKRCCLYRVDKKYATALKSKIFLRAFRFFPKNFCHYSWKGVANNMYLGKNISK